MHPLYQRLKELDSDTFEKLCFHLVQARFPTTQIRHVEGAAGDEGLDLFLGILDAGPTVWQCKSFANGVGKHQRDQIRASLKRALIHRPRRWVLCLSVDMDASAHRWFQRLQSSYAGRVDVALMQACDIVQELFYRSTIREIFFPHAVLDLAEFRDTVAKTQRLSTEELAALNDENLDRYLKRLEDCDARFAYSVTYRRNVQPVTTSRPEPGLIASISDERKTIDVFARDIEALKLNPPKAHFTVTDSGAKKMEELIRSGRAQVIEPGELLDYSSDFAFLMPPDAQIQGATLLIGPAAGVLRPRQVRVRFGSGAEAVVYESIRLDCTRHGREEVEFETLGGLPFCMSLVVQLSGMGSVQFESRSASTDVRAVRRFIRAVRALYTSHEFELYDLEEAVTLLKPRFSGTLPVWFANYEVFIDDAVQVEDFYGIELKMPEKLTNSDLESLAVLKGLIDGLPVAVNDVTCTLTKYADIDAAQAETVRGEGCYLLTRPEYLVRPVLFGVPVCTGPVAYHIPRARTENPEEVCRFLQTAPKGESITLSLKPLCPVQVRAVRPATSAPA